MAARPKRTEEDRASEEEEEDDDDDDDEEEEGCWEYDSTWEGDEEEHGPRAASADAASRRRAQDKQPSRWSPGGARWTPGGQERRRSNLSFRRYKGGGGRSWMAAKDMQKYRRHYPGLEEADVGEQDMWNLSFYKNEIRFLPNGLHIEDLLEVWQNDYVTLEENHSYIQWLFPLREQGMNWRARILTCQEIQAFRKSKEVMGRFVRAYKLMLGFYGIDLVNEETGELKRAENWRERFENLNMFNHNNLRITRILKCLGEMGFEHYQVHLVKFFLTETLVRQELPRVLKSALDYFMFTVRNKQARQELVHFAWRHFKPKHEFVWGPHKKLRRFKPKPGFLSSLKHGEKQELVLDGAGEAVMTDTLVSPSKVDLEDQAGEGTGEVLLQDTNETCVAGHAEGGTSNLIATTTPSLPSNDSVPAKEVEEEGISAVGGDGLPAGDVTEHQARPVSELEALEKTSKPRPAAVEEVRVEKGDSEGSPPVSFCPLEKKDLSGECGSGTDGESLKESKKRKLEKSRLIEASAGTRKGPSDIEKISLNLGEVVLDQKGRVGHAFPEEKAEPQEPEGNDDSSRYMKEAELHNTVVKRRKVEDMVVEDGTSNTPIKVDIKIMPTINRITDCGDPAVKRTDQTCEGETKTIGNASLKTVGVDFPSPSSPDHGFPLSNHLADEVDKPKTASMLASEEHQPHETLQSSGEKGSVKAREDNPDVEENAEDPAAANKNILAKTEEHEKCIARAEEK